MGGTAKIITELRREFAEMKRVGLNVPATAGWFISGNWKELEAMRGSGMTLREIADHVCSVTPVNFESRSSSK